MKICGVYKLQSKEMPDRIYIGSSIDVISRISGHLSSMLAGWSNPRMVDHFIEFGKEDFEFTIIEECSLDILRTREQYYITLYRPYFNIRNADGTALHNGCWEPIKQEKEQERFNKLDEIRKRMHKEHMAQYQICQ